MNHTIKQQLIYHKQIDSMMSHAAWLNTKEQKDHFVRKWRSVTQLQDLHEPPVEVFLAYMTFTTIPVRH